jgi:hypothetical protein
MSIGTHHMYVKNTPNLASVAKKTFIAWGILPRYCGFPLPSGFIRDYFKTDCPLIQFFWWWLTWSIPESLANHAHLSQSPWLSLAVTMSHFRTQHDTRVRLLAHALYHGLIEEDGGEFLAKTGSLVKDRNLRTRWNRSAFNYILKACGSDQDQRFWTKKVVHNAISCAMSISLRCITVYFSQFKSICSPCCFKIRKPNLLSLQ